MCVSFYYTNLYMYINVFLQRDLRKRDIFFRNKLIALYETYPIILFLVDILIHKMYNAPLCRFLKGYYLHPHTHTLFLYIVRNWLFSWKSKMKVTFLANNKNRIFRDIKIYMYVVGEYPIVCWATSSTYPKVL